MTVADLISRLREAEKKATPGPWRQRGSQGLHMDGTSNGYEVRGGELQGRSVNKCVSFVGRREGMADAELIALARTALPALLDVVEAAQGHEHSEWMGVEDCYICSALSHLKEMSD